MTESKGNNSKSINARVMVLAMNYQLKTITKYKSNFGEVDVASAPTKKLFSGRRN